jgi:hypothetical protein
MTAEYNSSGIFLSLISSPKNRNPQKFFEDEFKNGLFENYRKKFIENEVSSDNRYYLPKSYYLFGDFDIAIISLIDDLNFSNKIFHPAYYNKIASEHFGYQIITGVISNTFNESIPTLSDNTFLLKKDKFPLIGITKLKINNGLLIGSGLYLKELLYYYFLAAKKNNSSSFELIVFESFCSNEMGIIFFSDSYETIIKYILEFREIKLSELESYEKNTYKKVIESCLLNSFIGDKKNNISHSHVFSKTHTILGYDMEWLTSPNSFIPIKNESKNIRIVQNWDIKPGHLNDFLKIANDKDDIEIDTFEIPIGEGTLLTKFNTNNKELPDIFHSFKDLLKEDSIKNIEDHIDKVRTSIYIKDEDILKQTEKQTLISEHTHVTSILKKYIFEKDRIKTIQKKLTSINISYILQNRILRMFRNYNDGMLDSLLFGYFIELKGFMDFIESYILNDAEQIENLNYIHNILGEFVNVFERAYNNRYQQSYKTINYADINLEYNGGIHQLISCYDSAFKSILSKLGEDKPIGIAQVSSYESVSSIKYDINLNSFHVFMPELFASLIMKETSNFYYRRAKNNFSYENGLFLNRDEDGYLKMKSIRIILEDKLKQTGPDVKINSILINSITNTFFNYIITDMFTYRIGYNNNIDLYYHWFFCTYLQDTRMLNTNGEIYNISLLTQILRLVLLFNKDEHKILSNPPSDKINKRTWNTLYTICLKFKENLFEIKEINDWFKEIEDIVIVVEHSFLVKSNGNSIRKDIFQYHNYKVDIAINHDMMHSRSPQKKAIENMLNNYKNDYDTAKRKINSEIKKKKEKIEEYYHLFENKINKGEIIYYDEYMNKIPESLFIIILSYCLINIFYKAMKLSDDGKNYKIKMYSENKTPSSFISIDSLGGMYVPKQNDRFQFFKQRLAFVETLWHYSMLYKKNLFNTEN